MAFLLRFDRPTPLQYFVSLVAEDAGLPLLEAAIALAQDDDPTLDIQAVLAQVDEMADRLRRRLPDDAVALQRLRQLNAYFFHEMGFAGNVNNYHDRANSLLPVVLRTRRGIPISLAVLYLELASQVGLKASGVSFPEHFLVKVSLPRAEVVIDPFTGQSLSRDELDERLQAYRRRQGKDGEAAPLGLYLQAASPREILARMLRNLKVLHRAAGDWPRLAQVQQRLVLLLPSDWDERRDRALVLAELGLHAQAAEELALYLDHRPHARDAAALRRQLAAWRPGGMM